jgi:hypothetical protein
VSSDETHGERPSLEPPAPAEPRASELIGSALGAAARRAGLDPAQEASTGHVVWRAIGGWRGIIESVLPSLVFVVTFTATQDPAVGTGNLPLSLGLSVGIAALFTVVRLIWRSNASPALGGLIAAALAAGLALWTGRGEDNFLLGFFINGGYGAAFVVSAFIGWPIIGLAAGWLMGEATAWRSDRRKRRTFFWLTLVWGLFFFTKLAVQLPFYLSGDVTTLGVLKIAMGLPLFAPLLAVTWLVVRASYPRTGAVSDAEGSTRR